MTPFWILLELRMMEVVVVITGAKKCKAPVWSSPPTHQHPVFSQAGCPSYRLNQQCQSTERKFPLSSINILLATAILLSSSSSTSFTWECRSRHSVLTAIFLCEPGTILFWVWANKLYNDYYYDYRYHHYYCTTVYWRELTTFTHLPIALC